MASDRHHGGRGRRDARYCCPVAGVASALRRAVGPAVGTRRYTRIPSPRCRIPGRYGRRVLFRWLAISWPARTSELHYQYRADPVSTGVVFLKDWPASQTDVLITSGWMPSLLLAHPCLS